MLAAFVLSQLAALPDALLALWLMLLGKGVLERRSGSGADRGGGLGRVRGRHVVPAHRRHARAAAVPRQGHHRARIARRAPAGDGRDDRAPGTAGLSRSPGHAARTRCSCSITCTCRCSRHAAGSCGSVVTIALLMSIHPALILLAVFAIPTVFTVHLAAGASSARCRSAARRAIVSPGICSPSRRPPPGQGSPHRRHRPQPGDRAARGLGTRVSAGRRRPLALGDVARAGLGGVRRARMSARWSSSRRACRRPPSSVLLVLAAGARLSAYIGATVGEIGFLRGFWMDGARRLAWLEDYAASLAASADLPVPAHLRTGIRFDHVSFAYPGTDALGARRCESSRCRRAPSSPSSARTAPARPRW